MVKNSNGGKKNKGIARKSFAQDTFSDPKPNPPFEFIAVVTKMLGNSNCLVDILDSNHVNLICHIRGKFRGKHKSSHILHVHSTIIVGIRHWENTIHNVDLLHLLGDRGNLRFSAGGASRASPFPLTPSLVGGETDGVLGDELGGIVFTDETYQPDLHSAYDSRHDVSNDDDIVDIDDI